MRKVEAEDIGKFVMVDNPVISPDASKVAFVVTHTSIEENGYASNIWIFDRKSQAVVPLTNDGKSHRPTWSPDGRHIAFLRKDEDRAEIWVADPDRRGAEVRAFTGDGGIYQFCWHQNGEDIVFLFRPKDKDEIKEIEGLPFWFDGEGFIHHSPTQVFKLNLFSRDLTQLTDECTDVASFAPSNDGTKVAYCTAQRGNYYLRDVKTVDLGNGRVSEVGPGFCTFMSPVWSPDDKSILVQGNRYKRGMASHNGLWLVPAHGGEPKNLTKGLELNIGNSLYCDIKLRIPQGPVWQGDSIYFLLSAGGAVKLARYEMETRKIELVEDGDIGVNGFSINNGYIVFSEGTDSQPFEIWEKTSKQKGRITHFNDASLRDLSIARPERFVFAASDGQEVEGWIMKPVEFNPNTRYPAILWIHGGPKSKFGYAFMHEFQLYAANGYVVLYLNPRGSDGYTEEFADIRGHFGERDYQDIMEALDWAEDRYPFIDSHRLGVTGISYGGFMTNWIVTHTDRFAAAISEEGISDQITMFGTTDIGPFFNKDVIGGEPWSSTEKYLEKSPLFKADRVNTPIMFIHALDDFRCGVDQSVQLFTALRCLGRTTKLLLLPAGGHIVGWTGKPSFRIERLRQKLLWFDEFFKEGLDGPSRKEGNG